MDFQFTKEQEEFRKEIQDFLEEEIKNKKMDFCSEATNTPKGDHLPIRVT